ncbi:serine hydrolase domain-containing protein [Paenibacillus sp. SAFN-117]|uniref:serine hydrolase domain-containing protein n=1 Tax=Paenibacillus sp. SAFN-117 TaxID=3436860 RepID=UPI003F822175
MRIESDKPENHGLSSKALLEFFQQIEHSGLGVNSFMLLQNGKATAQYWRAPYRKDCPQLLFSLSKSFTSIAAGIAWDNGLLELEDNVISYFPDRLPDTMSPNLAKMSIHHLLSMNTGHANNIYGLVANAKDWVRAFLSLKVEREPGSFYLYNTHATYMLSAIIEQVTGQNLVDFLMPRLFEPLGIPRPSWETCPMGITAGGMGLSLTTESIAKFGQMLLNKGVYDGQRIVSERYIHLATGKQSDNRMAGDSADFTQGYGYQFHLCRRGCYRGDGAFGQLCFVAPRENLVIAATSSLNGRQQLKALLDLIYEHILDQLDNNHSPSLEDHQVLQQRLASVTYPVPGFQPVPEGVPDFGQRSYLMSENPRGLHKLDVSLKGKQIELQFTHDTYADRLLFDVTKPVHTQGMFEKDLALHRQEVVTYASWLTKNKLKLTLLYIETPYLVTYTLCFKERELELELNYEMNVSLSPHTKEFTAAGHCI